ncbi:MAG: murein biosynthesis integral membrane protein MurJ [Candidatus Sungbacteria bacterium RIFCSPLOWO2_01_FULL_60_25]|uniref:Probable lipid II flippase MurJ n=1 Tax=Candidatus Sungbacteria bacterium RIFCSPLOWO2_01_FULL_60_25 TaxID=1802281 RepID=A0A1G2LBP9_9BACT|nr:MAG: murein biosynthesis integral membrane protein MurJ [Candidatus Sungbacteria bacterium RIFCSPLOWO2_01_FULL_60_25]
MNIPFLNREVVSFHAAALVLGGAALVSKLLGLFRDRLLAARFGAGDELDVYYAAFQIPDILYALLLAGAASAAVLPALLSAERRGRDAGERFLGNLLTIFAVGSVAAAIVAAIVAPYFVPLLAPGFQPEKLELAIRLTRLMLGNVVFLGLASILSTLLQARHRFFAFALPSIVYNVGIIVGILAFVPALGVLGLAAGVLLGGMLQVLIQLPAVRGLGFRFRSRFDLRDPGFRGVLRTSLPRVAALSLSQITLAILAAIASLFVGGSLAAFRLAANLLFVPVGLFGVSYALAVFPKLSGASLDGAGEHFREHFAAGFRNILFWALPATALLIVLRAHIVRVILGSGAFDWGDTRLVAALLAAMAMAIVSESVLPLVLRGFYALGRTREPLLWNIIGSLSTIAFAFGLMRWFDASPGLLADLARVLRIGDLPNPEVLAVGVAFALGSLTSAALLLLALRRTVRRVLGVPIDLAGDIAVMVGASVLAGVAAYLALIPFPALIATNTFLGILAQGFTAGSVGCLVYGVILFTQKNPELEGLLTSIRGRRVSPANAPAVFETEKLDGEAGK